MASGGSLISFSLMLLMLTPGNGHRPDAAKLKPF
jgi:hypothetical protein